MAGGSKAIIRNPEVARKQLLMKRGVATPATDPLPDYEQKNESRVTAFLNYPIKSSSGNKSGCFNVSSSSVLAGT